MSQPGSREDAIRAQRMANLTPVKPGQVLNPAGRNQYSLRDDLKDAIDKLYAGAVPEPLRALIPAKVREMVEQNPGMTTAEVTALVHLSNCFSGNERALSDALDRLWPKVEKHEHTLPDGLTVEVRGEEAFSRLSGSLAGLTDGQDDVEGDREPAPRGSGDSLQ